MGLYKQLELTARGRSRVDSRRRTDVARAATYFPHLRREYGDSVDLSKHSLLPPIPGEGGALCTDPDWAARFPIVHAFLVQSDKPDGKPGKTGVLTIFPDVGCWKVRLADRNRGADLWAAGESIHAALVALETLFQEPVVPWRRAQAWGGGKMK